MDNLLTLVLEAHSPERNHHRQYAVTVGQDLFNEYTLVIRYGRPGRMGQEKRYASTEPLALRSIIRERLVRRLSAPKRIGCRYHVTAMNVATGIEPANWWPSEVLGRFDARSGSG